MPGFIIHIAVGKEYVKKHENEIKNIEEFLKGILAPDLISILNKKINKSITHYGKRGGKELEINLDKFLKDKKVDIKNDYWKGYFIHLITDSYFYIDTFKEETIEIRKNNDSFYYDYDCLNKKLIEKYNIHNIKNKNVSECIQYIDGTPKYLKEGKVIQFIEKISDISIEDQINRIKKKEK